MIFRNREVARFTELKLEARNKVYSVELRAMSSQTLIPSASIDFQSNLNQS